MENAPRHYVALAFLPVAIALVTLAALLVYQRGAEERRDRWQQPEAVLDAIGVRPGMRVAEWHPSDTYFLERLEGRVGAHGAVYAVKPSPGVAQVIEDHTPRVAVVGELPPAVDAILVVHVSAADQEMPPIEQELTEAGRRLTKGARVGLIGVGSDRLDHFIGPSELLEAAGAQGFRVVREESFLDPQFLLVLEKE